MAKSQKKPPRLGKDLIMALLAARGPRGQAYEPIRGKTRLMKMLFLFEEEVRHQLKGKNPYANASLPNFVAYDYGPFSVEVYRDLDFLKQYGFADTRPPSSTASPENSELEDTISENDWVDDDVPSSISEDANDVEIYLTDRGVAFVEAGNLPKLSTEQQRIVDEFKTRMCRATLRSILRYVYTQFPDMAEQSTIRETLMG